MLKPGMKVLYDANTYHFDRKNPPYPAQVLKIGAVKVQIRYFDPDQKKLLTRHVQADKLTPYDDLAEVNGLEAELAALRKQYAETCDALAIAQQANVRIGQVVVRLHERLNEAGIPAEGDLTSRVERLVGQYQVARTALGKIAGLELGFWQAGHGDLAFEAIVAARNALKGGAE